MSICGEHTLCRHEAAHTTLSRLYCRRWSCPECMPRNLFRLRRLAAAGEPTSFITLTSRTRRDQTPGDAARELVQAWRMVVQKMRRLGMTERLPFLAVFEETSAGWPHLHILARAPYIPHWWLSKQLGAMIDSPNVWITAVRSRRQASRYVAKYVSKGPGRFEGCKRFWRSQNWCVGADPTKTEKVPGVTYGVVRETIANVQRIYQSWGWTELEGNEDTVTLIPRRTDWWASGAPPPEELQREFKRWMST